jgi:hypothetical protein
MLHIVTGLTASVRAAVFQATRASFTVLVETEIMHFGGCGSFRFGDQGGPFQKLLHGFSACLPFFWSI